MDTQTTSPGFGDLVATGAAWLLAGCAVWTALICGAALLEALTGGRLRALSWVACPPSLRGPLLVGLGAVLASTPAARASTDDLAAAPTPALPSPARPTGTLVDEAPRIVVRPGDALWRLAETRLPDRATAAAVDDLVDRLHRRNREVIGPDPDLIRPGQRLVVPSPHPPDSSCRLEEKP